MLESSERHLQRLNDMSGALVRAVKVQTEEFWTTSLKPCLGGRGASHVNNASKHFEKLERWQIAILTAFLTILVVQLLASLKDSLSRFQEKGEQSARVNIRPVGNMCIFASILQQVW